LGTKIQQFIETSHEIPNYFPFCGVSKSKGEVIFMLSVVAFAAPCLDVLSASAEKSKMPTACKKPLKKAPISSGNEIGKGNICYV
jgi:hypothetical protein